MKVLAIHFGESVTLKAPEYDGLLNPTLWKLVDRNRNQSEILEPKAVLFIQVQG